VKRSKEECRQQAFLSPFSFFFFSYLEAGTAFDGSEELHLGREWYFSAYLCLLNGHLCCQSLQAKS
jgi:hypothetical protein